jgi:predicted lysophospholipase L1 biosynthesis ABC-type transport system permease subunit
LTLTNLPLVSQRGNHQAPVPILALLYVDWLEERLLSANPTVVTRVLLLVAVGLAISVPAALAASHLVKSFLFQTRPNDPETLALAGVILLIAAILAGYAPARRASRIDPLAALRQE